MYSIPANCPDFVRIILIFKFKKKKNQNVLISEILCENKILSKITISMKIMFFLAFRVIIRYAAIGHFTWDVLILEFQMLAGIERCVMKSCPFSKCIKVRSKEQITGKTYQWLYYKCTPIKRQLPHPTISALTFICTLFIAIFELCKPDWPKKKKSHEFWLLWHSHCRLFMEQPKQVPQYSNPLIPTLWKDASQL